MITFITGCYVTSYSGVWVDLWPFLSIMTESSSDHFWHLALELRGLVVEL